MFCALKTRLRALFSKVMLQVLPLTANITLNTVVSNVTAKSAIFEVNLP